MINKANNQQQLTKYFVGIVDSIKKTSPFYTQQDRYHGTTTTNRKSVKT